MNSKKRLVQLFAAAAAVLIMGTPQTLKAASTEEQTENNTTESTEIASTDTTEQGSETETASSISSEALTETESASDTETSDVTEALVETDIATEEVWVEISSEPMSEVEESVIQDDIIYTYSDLSDGSRYLLLPSFSELWQDLYDMIEDYEGVWSIYVKDLKSSLGLTINDQPQDSASLIKLYIAGAVMEEVRNQEIEYTDTIERLLSEMISLSDNEAANELVRYLSDDHDHQDGLKKVNEFIERHGYSDTHQYNGLEDPDLWYGDEVNITSVTDCGRLLEEIYDGQFVNHLISRQIEYYLLNQDITWKIPAGIPSEVKTANKTGEKDNTQNDVSIVYTPYRDYILCVMATGLTDEDTAVENIRAISKTVYDFFELFDDQLMIAEYPTKETKIVVSGEE